MAAYHAWEAYIAKNYGAIQRGEEFMMEVIALDLGDTRVVRCKVAESPEALPGSEELWVKNEDGAFIPKNPWAIKVLEELDIEETEFTILPVTTKPIYGG
jgi:hypothetical protein